VSVRPELVAGGRKVAEYGRPPPCAWPSILRGRLRVPGWESAELGRVGQGWARADGRAEPGQRGPPDPDRGDRGDQAGATGSL